MAGPLDLLADLAKETRDEVRGMRADLSAFAATQAGHAARLDALEQHRPRKARGIVAGASAGSAAVVTALYALLAALHVLPPPGH